MNPDSYASPLFHLFSGAAMLGAFFIATDPVSACTTPLGRSVLRAGHRCPDLRDPHLGRLPGRRRLRRAADEHGGADHRLLHPAASIRPRRKLNELPPEPASPPPSCCCSPSSARRMVAYTYDNTRERIAANERATLLRKLHRLIPPGSHDNVLLQDTLQVQNETLLGTSEPVTRLSRPQAGQAGRAGHQGGGARRLQRRHPSAGGHQYRRHAERRARGVAPRNTRGWVTASMRTARDWILGFTGRSLQRPATAEMGGEEGRRRVRPVHRRHHHAARRGEGGAQGPAILPRHTATPCLPLPKHRQSQP